jgi:hypothetical protein
VFAIEKGIKLCDFDNEGESVTLEGSLIITNFRLCHIAAGETEVTHVPLISIARGYFLFCSSFVVDKWGSPLASGGTETPTKKMTLAQSFGTITKQTKLLFRKPKDTDLPGDTFDVADKRSGIGTYYTHLHFRRHL